MMALMVVMVESVVLVEVYELRLLGPPERLDPEDARRRELRKLEKEKEPELEVVEEREKREEGMVAG